MIEVEEKLVFEVDGASVATDDSKLKGRDVRTLAGLVPVGDYRLIEVMDRYTAVVGLETPIVFKDGEKRVFRSFASDRDYEFEVNELGWAWGASTISEADVRSIGRIADDRDIFVSVAGEGEKAVPRGGMIDLGGAGFERILTRHHQVPVHTELHVTFVIGGEPVKVAGRPESTLVSLLAKALEETENTGQDVANWQVTDGPGNPLDTAKTLHELGIEDGALLVASLKAGAAG
ncbi:MAG: DUF2604 domain-containing protein [Janthinobacterium lividum]